MKQIGAHIDVNAEKWVNTKTGKPYGANNDRHAYCRPSKKISTKTPVVRGGKKDAAMQRQILIFSSYNLYAGSLAVI